MTNTTLGLIQLLGFVILGNITGAFVVRYFRKDLAFMEYLFALLFSWVYVGIYLLLGGKL